MWKIQRAPKELQRAVSPFGFSHARKSKWFTLETSEGYTFPTLKERDAIF